MYLLGWIQMKYAIVHLTHAIVQMKYACTNKLCDCTLITCDCTNKLCDCTLERIHPSKGIYKRRKIRQTFAEK